VSSFCVLLVPEWSGVPVTDSFEAAELPVAGDLIRIQGTLAEVTHVWPRGDQAADLRAITRPKLEGWTALSRRSPSAA
jgi:hypothetical protein